MALELNEMVELRLIFLLVSHILFNLTFLSLTDSMMLIILLPIANAEKNVTKMQIRGDELSGCGLVRIME